MIAIVLLIVLVITAGYVVVTEYNALYNYCYKVDYAKSSFNLQGSTLEVNTVISFQNNADVDIKINGYNFYVYLNNTHISNVNSNQSQILASKVYSDLSIQFKVDLSSIQGLSVTQLVSLAAPSDSDIITIKGYASAGILGLSISHIPMELSYTTSELYSQDSSDSSCAS